MANTNQSIKGASDIELNAILYRVQRELDVLRMIRELKLKSTPNPDGQYPEYSTFESFSTETPVNNGKSIKDMTDKELGDFQNRLQNENELARLIFDIREMNKPTVNIDGTYYIGQPYEGISLDTPVNNLYHVGILGMHWGQRKQTSLVTNSDGSKMHVTTDLKTGQVLKIKHPKDHNYSEDYKKAAELKKVNYRSLSNTEMKNLTSRLQLEQSLRTLKTGDRTKALEVVKTVTAVGTTIAGVYALSKTPLGQDVIKVIKSKIKK
jgi:predicted small secreted protein